MGKILQIGEELDGGRLKVVGQLESSGQYAEIYRVRKRRVHLERLLKVNLPHNMLDKNGIAESVYEFSKENHIVRTDREIEILMMFDHPNIAHVEDVIPIKKENKGILFQPIPGARTLRELIINDNAESKRDKDAKLVMRIIKLMKMAKNLIKAIDYIHLRKYGVLHRDIRPENIVIDDFNQAFLIDFGLACKEESFDGRWGSLTYAPPEIYKGKGNAYSDLWSLGVCLYEYLTGEHPVDNSPDLKKRRERIIKKMRSLSQKNTTIGFFNNLIEKLMKIKNHFHELNSEEFKSLYFTEKVRKFLKEKEPLEIPFKIDEQEVNRYLSNIASFCLPLDVSRTVFRYCNYGVEEFNDLIKRKNDGKGNIYEHTIRTVQKILTKYEQ